MCGGGGGGGVHFTMFTMLIFVLSLKDSKCFWDPHFGYIVTIKLFHYVLLNCWLASCSSHYVVCVYCVVSIFFMFSLFCFFPLLRDKQGLKFGGMISTLCTHLSSCSM